MFFSRNKKKVGFKGLKLYRHVLVMCCGSFCHIHFDFNIKIRAFIFLDLFPICLRDGLKIGDINVQHHEIIPI